MLQATGKQTGDRRKTRKIIVALATLIIVGVLGDGIIGMMFRAQVAGAVQRGMGADFGAGLAWYIPPRGVSLHHVRISKAQPDGSREEYITAARVILKLAEFPKAGSPLIINLLQIDSPTITIVSRPPPVITPAVVVSDLAAPPPPPNALPAPPQKIDIRNFKITDGQIALEQPGQDTLLLDHINIAFNPAEGSSRTYRFSSGMDSKTSTSANGAGSINIDDMTLGISELSLQAKVGAILSQAHLSGTMKNRLEMAQIDGTLNIHGSASVPLKDWRMATYSADFQLASGKGAFPGSSITVDSAQGDVHVQGDGKAMTVKITVGNFIANSGASQLRIDGGNFATGGDHANWQIAGLLGRLDLAGGIAPLYASHLKGRFLFTGRAGVATTQPSGTSLLSSVEHELIVYPHDVSAQPPKYPVPVEHINGGPITLRGGIVRFQSLNATYGGDQVLLDEAHITLDDPLQKISPADLRRQIKIDGIAGTLICRQPGPLYPANLGKVIAQLRPKGTFAIGGGSWYAINRRMPDQVAKPKADFFFRVSTAGGAFALTDHKLPLTDIHADAEISPMLVDIPNLRGNFLDGTVIAGMKITPVRPVSYTGTATFYNVNLQTASRDMAINLKKPLIGKMYLKVKASGQGAGGAQTPVQSFAADGEFQIADGNFGDIQTVRAAASNVTKADQVLDGQAAGVFSIRNESVILDSCAVGNPMFGLEGSGKVGFDKSLDIHAVAAPLGDWREALKRSNVPLLEDVGSNIAGAIQQLFAGAQRTLLWDIHITGTTTNPTVEQTAAPVITKSVVDVFSRFIRGGKDGELIDQIRPKN